MEASKWLKTSETVASASRTNNGNDLGYNTQRVDFVCVSFSDGSIGEREGG